jgi:predicted amidophosphoribosyltransferase
MSEEKRKCDSCAYNTPECGNMCFTCGNPVNRNYVAITQEEITDLRNQLAAKDAEIEGLKDLVEELELYKSCDIHRVSLESLADENIEKDKEIERLKIEIKGLRFTLFMSTPE